MSSSSNRRTIELAIAGLLCIRPPGLGAAEESPVASSLVRIVSPAPGTAAKPGDRIRIHVEVSERRIFALRVTGEDIGSSPLKREPPFDFELQIPRAALGRKQLRALVLLKSGKIVTSDPVSLDIVPAGPPARLIPHEPKIYFAYPGERAPVGIDALYEPGAHRVTLRPSDLTYLASNEHVARVDASGEVTAVGPGESLIEGRYQGRPALVSVFVPRTIPGDFDNDGVVTPEDMNILLAALPGAPAPAAAFDARDLNHDGRLDEKDVQILRTLMHQSYLTTVLEWLPKRAAAGQPLVLSVTVRNRGPDAAPGGLLEGRLVLAYPPGVPEKETLDGTLMALDSPRLRDRPEDQDCSFSWNGERLLGFGCAIRKLDAGALECFQIQFVPHVAGYLKATVRVTSFAGQDAFEDGQDIGVYQDDSRPITVAAGRSPPRSP